MSHMRSEFRRALADGVLVADGAIGTMLMSKLGQLRGTSLRVCLNLCLDELNVSRPELVREVHQECVRAEAQTACLGLPRSLWPLRRCEPGPPNH